jgi:hypothetical protein
VGKSGFILKKSLFLRIFQIKKMLIKNKESK